MRKNTVMIKERDEWSGLAQFLGNMIAKYADEIDFLENTRAIVNRRFKVY